MWLPFLPHATPSRSLQSAWLGSLGYTATSHQLSAFMWECIYVSATFSIPLTLSFPRRVKSVLSICVSNPSQQIGSLVSFF